jgi:hypothetical protein
LSVGFQFSRFVKELSNHCPDKHIKQKYGIMSTDLIAPHGGELINRLANATEKQDFLAKADSLPRVKLDERATSDLVMIAIGGFSPISGFMGQDDYLGVVLSLIHI